MTHPVTPRDTDTVVREEATEVVRRIAEKVAARAHEARALAADEDDLRDRLSDALTYAVSALQAIETALALGRGGYVGWDDETSLYFRGLLEGAAIDRDDSFSVHT
jgi:predicted PP-loop superfamily ATPase